MALYPVYCYSEKEKIHLTNYADLIVTDENHCLVGMRFGGYPESVMAMTDAVMFGSQIFVNIGNSNIEITNRNHNGYSRKTSHDGIYAESLLFLKDSDFKTKGEEE